MCYYKVTKGYPGYFLITMFICSCLMFSCAGQEPVDYQRMTDEFISEKTIEQTAKSTEIEELSPAVNHTDESADINTSVVSEDWKSQYESYFPLKSLPEDTTIKYRCYAQGTHAFDLLLCENENEPYGISFYFTNPQRYEETFGYQKVELIIDEDIQYDALVLLPTADVGPIAATVIGFVKDNVITYHIYGIDDINNYQNGIYRFVHITDSSGYCNTTTLLNILNDYLLENNNVSTYRRGPMSFEMIFPDAGFGE